MCFLSYKKEEKKSIKQHNSNPSGITNKSPLRKKWAFFVLTAFEIYFNKTEKQKSPNFAQQSGLLFGMSPFLGIRASVIPADHDRSCF
jgi:hypothetical protein